MCNCTAAAELVDDKCEDGNIDTDDSDDVNFDDVACVDDAVDDDGSAPTTVVVATVVNCGFSTCLLGDTCNEVVNFVSVAIAHNVTNFIIHAN